MSTIENLLFLAFVSAIVIIFFVLLIAATRVAYKNGVRDGYKNTFLRNVQEQVKEEHLVQGDRVRYEDEQGE